MKLSDSVCSHETGERAAKDGVHKVTEYKQIADEKLIARLRGGEEEIMDFILEKYKGMVKKKARTLFLIGGDTDDLIQEGMIGLYKAIRDYDLEREVSFASFAELCVSRQLYTAINSSNRKKHSPLNSYISLYSQDFATAAEVTESGNPEYIVIDQENARQFELALEAALSAFEKQVLALYIEGISYLEIAARMDKSPKSIDNAIQRIKTKALKILEGKE